MAACPETVYIADHADEIIVHAQQGWGSLGLNTAIRPRHKPPTPLRINDKRYQRGLGMHARGEVLIDLAGAYRTFEAQVGVHYQRGGKGSVVAQVFVDDKKRFDSGVMREGDAPMPVRVSVESAEELRLVVTDAGDGITCDAADWGHARLIRNPNAPKQSPARHVDIAPFGKVVTFDPERLEGTHAKRTEPMPAEDVFLSDALLARPDGGYDVPVTSDGVGCIGLEWVEERFLRSVDLTFERERTAARHEQIELQIWHGQSAWQGKWVPATCAVRRDGAALSWRLQPAYGRRATQKVRWLIRDAKGVVVKHLSAQTTSRWRTAELRIERRKGLPRAAVVIDVYNGEVASAGGEQRYHRNWDTDEPLRLTVDYARTHRCKTDRTVLRFAMTDTPFAIAVEDVVRHGCVWIPHADVFVSQAPARMTLGDHLAAIKDRKTVLERVRNMPDQSFAQAMERVHQPIQDRGPTMLSLACDDRKFVVDRDGTVTFHLYSSPDEPLAKKDYYLAKFPYRVRPTFGDGPVRPEQISRHLDGAWLPIPVSVARVGDVTYRQRTYVAPRDADPPEGAPVWFRERALCVAEYEVINGGTKPTDASLTLRCVARNKAQPLSVRSIAHGAVITCGRRLIGLLDTHADKACQVDVKDNVITLTARLDPNGKARCGLYLPGWPCAQGELRSLTNPSRLRDAVETYWQAQLNSAATIVVPNDLLTHLIRASQVHCLMAARNEAGGRRVAAWTAADRYGPLESEAHAVIRGMDMMGHSDFARRSLDYFIHRYDPSGYLTTGYTLMGTGWHLWTLAEHVDRTDGLAWLSTVGDDVARACTWIMRQRRKTMRRDARGTKVPEYGLVPAGVFADWPRFTFTTFQAAQYCAGLCEAARVLGKIGHGQARALAEDAEHYRQDIERAYGWTRARTPVVRLRNGEWVPGYPPLIYCFGEVGGFFPGEDGSRAWCKNAMAHQLAANRVLDPRCDSVGWMLDHMEDVEFLRGGLGDYPEDHVQADFFNLGGFNKCQPYYRRNVELYALRDDVKPFIRSYFNTPPTLLNTENLTLWEHFHNQGAWNKTHETGWFLCQTRLMFVMERGDALWLAPFLPAHWLGNGMRVRVGNVPTTFGRVSFEIRSNIDTGRINLTVTPPTRSMPAGVVVRLRHPHSKPIKSASIAGKPGLDVRVDDDVLRLPPLGESFAVEVRY